MTLIAQAAARRPSAEGELLRVASTHSLRGLKERCTQVKAGAASAKEEAERYKAIRDSRYVRHWADEDGAFRLDAKLTPDAGAQVLAALGAEERRCFDEARNRGERLAEGAAMADALVRLVSSGPSAGDRKGGSKTTPAVLVIRTDGAALMRGHAEPGETCTIPGIGPVPVATVRRLLPGAFIKVLITDGTDVQSVVHVGRAVPAHVETALEERDLCCVVPGCDVTHGLEKHHWDMDYRECKTTSLTGLARVCSWHHDLLTYDGYALRGGPGAWEFVAPEGGTEFDTG